MKILVYILFVEDGIDEWLDTIELDSTFEKRKVKDVNKSSLMEKWKDDPPGVILTFGVDFAPFQCLNSLPYDYRRRWLHFTNKDDFDPKHVIHCYIGFLFHQKHDDTNPLLSVFTTAFQSSHRILRPYHSLLRQTYTNWEWIILDDTDEESETWQEQRATLKRLEQSDLRIRVYKSLRHSGYIGALKKQAAGMAYGDWLLEVDHDDDLHPHLFQWIVDAIRLHPTASFIYSDCVETFENTLDRFSYGDSFGLGYGAYYTTLYENRFQNVCVGTPINRLCMSHIVGVPNHIRCWNTMFYHKIGGHNPHLPVADDYELILRTILHSDTWVRIAALGYIQYRNDNGNNFTFRRNQLIQDLVRLISITYSDAIRQRFNQLFNIDEQGYVQSLPQQIYKCHRIPYPVLEKVYVPNNATFSIIIPTYNRPNHLIRALQSILNQTYQSWIVYIVGDACPMLERLMETLRQRQQFDHRFRFWNLQENNGAGGAIPRNYALYVAQTEWIAYLDDDNTWQPNHLETCKQSIDQHKDIQFVFSSFNVDGKPLLTDVPVKGSLDTSCVVHRRDLIYKYGLWKNREEAGYAHDYEFFSRFLHEKWVATGQPTMNYFTEFNPQSYDSIRQLYEHYRAEYRATHVDTR